MKYIDGYAVMNINGEYKVIEYSQMMLVDENRKFEFPVFKRYSTASAYCWAILERHNLAITMAQDIAMVERLSNQRPTKKRINMIATFKSCVRSLREMLDDLNNEIDKMLAKSIVNF